MKYAAVAIAALLLVGVVTYVYLGEPQTRALPATASLEETIPGLVARLGAGEGLERLAPISALGHIANNIQPSSTAPLNTDDPVAKANWERAIAAQRQRREQAGAMLRAGVPTLIDLARNADPGVRREALWALGAFRTEAKPAASALASIATDTTAASHVRQSALVALSRVDSTAALEVITSIVDRGDADAGLMSAATFALRGMGGSAVPLLQTLLRDTEILRRGWALDALRSMRAEAAPAAGDVAAALMREQDPRLVRAALRTLMAIAPDDTVSLEWAIATPSLSRDACTTAGEALGRRPGAIAFDSGRCDNHVRGTTARETPESVRRALVAAAGGPTDFVVTALSAGRQRGEGEESVERVIVACVQPSGTAEAVRAAGRDASPNATTVGSRELRLAAVRVAGDDVILDSTGGPVDVDAPTTACSEVLVDAVSDPTRWPAAQLKFTTLQPTGDATTVIEWVGAIDASTRQWIARLPARLSHLRADRTHFSDELRTLTSRNREVTVTARFAGIETPVNAALPHIAVRFAPPMVAGIFLGTVADRMVIPAPPLARAPWTRVVMYPAQWRGSAPEPQSIPEGIPIVTLAGVLIIPSEPADPRQKVTFWREQAGHAHLAVRLRAAAALVALKDRESLPQVVQILTAPSDLATEAAAFVAAYGADAVPLVTPLLRDGRAHVRSAAWSAIAKIGAPAVPQLRDVLQNGTPEDRASALKALNRMQPPQAAGLAATLVPMIDRCDTPEWTGGCGDLLDALTAAGPPAAAAQPALERRVAQTTGYDRLRTARALLAVGGRDRAVTAMSDVARTGRDNDAENALVNLVSVLKSDALPVLSEVLQRRDAPTAGASAARQLGELGAAAEQAFPVIAVLARDPDPAVRRRVLPAFKGLRTPDALVLLGSLMRDPDSVVRRETFLLLRDRGIEAVPLLTPLFSEPGNPLRHDLVVHLGRLGPAVAQASPSTVVLVERLSRNDQDSLLRSNAARALASIRGTPRQSRNQDVHHITSP